MRQPKKVSYMLFDYLALCAKDFIDKLRLSLIRGPFISAETGGRT